MLEKLLADFLNIKDRKDFRVQNKGNLIPINFDLLCDKSYIKSVFKRKMLELNPNMILLVNDKFERTCIDLKSSFKTPLDITLIEDRNKVLISINNWIEEERKNGHIPSNIKFI